MGAAVLIGVAVSGQDPTTSVRAVFENVGVSQP
jgi:hypothetical protein